MNPIIQLSLFNHILRNDSKSRENFFARYFFIIYCAFLVLKPYIFQVFSKFQQDVIFRISKKKRKNAVSVLIFELQLDIPIFFKKKSQ